MRPITITALMIGVFALLANNANAADLYRHRHSHVTHSKPIYPRLRVVEQVPYCGNCDNIIGTPSSGAVRLRYIGWPVWERGCALGGCYGYYTVAPSCYLREAPFVDRNGDRPLLTVCD